MAAHLPRLRPRHRRRRGDVGACRGGRGLADLARVRAVGHHRFSAGPAMGAAPAVRPALVGARPRREVPRGRRPEFGEDRRRRSRGRCRAGPGTLASRRGVNTESLRRSAPRPVDNRPPRTEGAASRSRTTAGPRPPARREGPAVKPVSRFPQRAARQHRSIGAQRRRPCGRFHEIQWPHVCPRKSTGNQWPERPPSHRRLAARSNASSWGASALLRDRPIAGLAQAGTRECHGVGCGTVSGLAGER